MKFSIRDLLLVTVIVALAAGWRLDRSRLGNTIKQLKRQVEWLEDLSITVIEPTALPNSSAPAPNPSKP